MPLPLRPAIDATAHCTAHIYIVALAGRRHRLRVGWPRLRVGRLHALRERLPVVRRARQGRRRAAQIRSCACAPSALCLRLLWVYKCNR